MTFLRAGVRNSRGRLHINAFDNIYIALNQHNKTRAKHMLQSLL